MQRFQLKAKASDAGKRLDIFLAEHLTSISRRKIKATIDAGGVYLNGKRVRMASKPLASGDQLQVEHNPEGFKKLENKNFKLEAADILFYDFGILAINKPPGLPSQATRDQSRIHAETIVREYFKGATPDVAKTAPKTLVLVHRLDMETSGILLFATSNEAATKLTDMFRTRDIHKTYLSLSHGQRAVGTKFHVKNFLAPIDKKTGHVNAVTAGGKTAETDFEVLAANAELDCSLIKCMPKTGRSHQIRVHLTDEGLPIIGDKRYGTAKKKLPEEIAALATHHMLHAAKIEFAWQNGIAVQIEAALPASFEALRAALKI